MDNFVEAQKSMKNVLEIIHKRNYNILLKYKRNEDVSTDLIKLLDFVFDEMRVIEKDIKISESATDNN